MKQKNFNNSENLSTVNNIRYVKVWDEVNGEWNELMCIDNNPINKLAHDIVEIINSYNVKNQEYEWAYESDSNTKLPYYLIGEDGAIYNRTDEDNEYPAVYDLTYLFLNHEEHEFVWGAMFEILLRLKFIYPITNDAYQFCYDEFQKNGINPEYSYELNHITAEKMEQLKDALMSSYISSYHLKNEDDKVYKAYTYYFPTLNIGMVVSNYYLTCYFTECADVFDANSLKEAIEKGEKIIDDEYVSNGLTLIK